MLEPFTDNTVVFAMVVVAEDRCAVTRQFVVRDITHRLIVACMSMICLVIKCMETTCCYA